MTFRALIRKPTAFLPIAMSAAALVFLLGYVALFGVTHGPDVGERGPARLFQLVMAIQFVIVLLHAVTWLPREPRPAVLVLVLQLAAALVPIVTVIILESWASGS